MKPSIFLLPLFFVSASFPVLAGPKDAAIPEGYKITHTGARGSNVVFEFRDASEEKWPMFFDGDTVNPVDFVYSKNGPKCSFVSVPAKMSLGVGDQSRRILGEIIRYDEETVVKKGETRTRQVTNWGDFKVQITAAGPLVDKTETYTHKGKQKTRTVQVMATDVVVFLNGKSTRVRAETIFSTRARDGKMGTVQWRTKGSFPAKAIGLKEVADKTIEFHISTALYPPAEPKKKRKKKK